MITSIKDTNADQYSILFSKAVKDLMRYTEDGELIENPGSATSAMDIATIEFDQETPYEPNVYYRWDATKKEFELATEDEAQENVNYYELKSEYIASLNEYFSYIETLARINPIYTALALDEPTFDIDLNTREIKVPDVFQKNGVSVEGDEIAEIIYFKVDRYFDMIDLSTQEIYIQWRSADTNEDGEYIEGVSTPWCIDYESYPGQIVFGWPISSKITAKAGQIAFAVRFYKYNTDINERNPLIYSLSTLTQTVNVKPALNFDLVDKILREGIPADGFIDDNNSSLIRTRLINTDINNGGGEPAETPIFRFNLVDPEETAIIGENLTEGWMTENAAGFRIENKDILIQAYTTDAGHISYQGSKTDLQDVDDPDYDKKREVYRETTDTSKQNFKKYYFSNGVGLGYSEITNFSEVEWDKDEADYVPIYERYYQMTIDSIGKYKVLVTNRVGRKTAKAVSYRLVVNRPAEVSISTDVIGSAVLENADDTEVLSVVASAEDSAHSKFTYQWYRKDLDGNNFVAINGATDNTYEADQEGYYKVEVHNNLHVENDTNHSLCYTDTTSSEARITKKAQPCTVTVVGNQVKTMGQLQNSPFEISAGLPADEENKHIAGEMISYQWYDYETADGGDYDADKAAANRGEYEGTSSDIAVEGATQATFTPSAESRGDFYCKVTNHYNGTTADKISPFFTIGG